MGVDSRLTTGTENYVQVNQTNDCLEEVDGKEYDCAEDDNPKSGKKTSKKPKQIELSAFMKKLQSRTNANSLDVAESIVLDEPAMPFYAWANLGSAD